jgi:hypothetical protein
MIFKATGSKEKGYRIAIPSIAYEKTGQPREYDCVVFRDGTLVYQPVKP